MQSKQQFVARREKNMTLGESLKSLRTQKKVSLEQVAEDLGLTRQAIYNYEADMRVPRDEIKIKLANYYGVSIEELFFKDKATKCC